MQNLLTDRLTTEVQNLLTLWGQEGVVNVKAIVASIAVKTNNRGAELIDIVGTRSSGQSMRTSSIDSCIKRQQRCRT